MDKEVVDGMPNGMKSCTNCKHNKVCSAFSAMNQIVEQFEGMQTFVKFPFEPAMLGTQCEEYESPLKKEVPLDV